MTYGTRHVDKKTSKGDDAGGDSVPSAAPETVPTTTATSVPQEKKGVQVLVSFSSDQVQCKEHYSSSISFVFIITNFFVDGNYDQRRCFATFVLSVWYSYRLCG